MISFFTYTVRHWQVKVVPTAIFKRLWQVPTLNFLFCIENFGEFLSSNAELQCR